MMVFIIIVCNADWDLITTTATGIMTWYEEWRFFFEFIWGRTMTSLSAVSRNKSFGMNRAFLCRVFDSKLRLVLRARESWPTYCSYKENKVLMGDKWKERYSGHRIIQWDNTDIKMHKPGSADMQRSTYSSYYSSNCAKGAVRLQLCGWMGTKCLFPGAISDTE